MRIAAIAHFYIPHCRGGAELMLHEMLVSLVKAGHEVEVAVCDQGQGTQIIDGVRVHYGRSAMARIKKIAVSGDFDVIVSHLKEYPRAFSLARTTGTKIVQVLHNDNGETRVNLAMLADLNVFNTNWLKKDLRAPGLVVHPPVWMNRHRAKPGEHVTLVNLIPAKGSDMFYRLAARMPEQPFLGVKGGYGRQMLQKLPNVTFQETTSNMKDDVWRRTSVLLMPSDYESYGMAGVEALASGIPVIAHPTPGLQESLGDAGIFIDRKDVDAWEKALRAILNDPDEYRTASLTRAAQIDTAGELSRFVQAVETL